MTIHDINDFWLDLGIVLTLWYVCVFHSINMGAAFNKVSELVYPLAAI